MFNFWKNSFRCKKCGNLIATHPCTYCGFIPVKPKNPMISEGYQSE